MKYAIPAPVPAKEGCNILYRVLDQKAWTKTLARRCFRDWIAAYHPKMRMGEKNRLRTLVEERWEEFQSRPEIVKFLKENYYEEV